MKTIKHTIVLFFCILINHTFAQIKHYDFNVLAYGGIGFGVMENDSDPNYNMNSSSSEILLKYRVTHKFGLATGVGLNTLSGDGFNANGNFHHEKKLIKIPLVAILDYGYSDKMSLIPNFGFYTQYIIEDKHRFLNNELKNVYDGWNFGAQVGFGLTFELYTNFSLGFNYNLQLDLTEFSSNSNQFMISDQQKLGKMNTFGVVLVMEL